MTSADLAWLALAALIGLWMLGAHNRVTALRGAVIGAWGAVDQALAQRAEALAALLAAVATPLASEAAALDAVSAAQAQVLAATDAVRRKPVTPDAVADLSKADAVLAAVLVRLLALVEQQSALQAAPAVGEALAALRQGPPQLAFARQRFNEAGSAYNAATQQYPTRLLESVFRFGQAGKL